MISSRVLPRVSGTWEGTARAVGGGTAVMSLLLLLLVFVVALNGIKSTACHLDSDHEGG